MFCQIKMNPIATRPCKDASRPIGSRFSTTSIRSKFPIHIHSGEPQRFHTPILLITTKNPYIIHQQNQKEALHSPNHADEWTHSRLLPEATVFPVPPVFGRRISLVHMLSRYHCIKFRILLFMEPNIAPFKSGICRFSAEQSL